MNALQRLEATVRRLLAMFSYPWLDWMTPPTQQGGLPVYDVVIAGAGEPTLALTAALRQERITNVLILDTGTDCHPTRYLDPQEALTDRFRLDFAALEFCLPLLTFPTWHRARYGESPWRHFGAPLAKRWHAYLGWYREALDLPPIVPCGIARIDPADGLIRLTLSGEAGRREVLARELVVSDGRAQLARTCPRQIDRNGHAAPVTLRPVCAKGSRLLVLGAEAACFEAGLMATRAGAEVHHLVAGGSGLAGTEPDRDIHPGLVVAYPELDDAGRAERAPQLVESVVPPPADWVEAATATANYHLSTAHARVALSVREGRIRAANAESLGTFDLAVVPDAPPPEYLTLPTDRRIDANICRWSDRLPDVDGVAGLARFPYLGPFFELTERMADQTPWLRHIRLFGTLAIPSLGPCALAPNLIRYSVPRLVEGISRSRFLREAASLYDSFCRYEEAERRIEAATKAAAQSP